MATIPQLPEALIRAAVRSRLHSFIAESFLCGLYTLLFAQAMWRLFCKGNKWIYMVVLSTLWSLIICGFAADWELQRLIFTVYNDNPADMALHIADSNDTMPKTDVILDSNFLILTILLGDGLLIWRVHLLWNGDKRNWYITAFFSMLLTGTTVVGFMFWNPHNHFSRPTERVLTAVFFLLSATTTFLGTSLIILRILFVSKRSRSPHSYRKVIEILVESSVVYSIGMLIIAITELILLRESASNVYSIDELETYAGSILTPLTGIAPTLIALRVAREGRDTEVKEIRPMPRLQFRRANKTAQTATANGSRGVLSILRFARTNTTGSGGTVLDSRESDQIREEMPGVKTVFGSNQNYNVNQSVEKCPAEEQVV